ncbi:MAG: DUF2157 domain-containing protein [Phycisphaeraceae bacterium]|nr:DUF2157 domain-containing protein [Phycisphaeraceae bacterium]
MGAKKADSSGQAQGKLTQIQWLQTQVKLWVQGALIAEGQGQAILGQYESIEELLRKRNKRAFMALCAVAILMFAVGVLLLISHNWDQIPRIAKVSGIFAAVAAAFLASVAAYGRGSNLWGELLALAGTLLFGNAIWLLAQIFHIEAHYPDGIMWWMIGTLAVAWLVGSRLNGMAAVVLMTVWTGMETGDFQRPNYQYLIFAAAALLLTLRLRAAVMTLLVELSLAFWLMMVAGSCWHLGKDVSYLMGLLGCAYFGVGVIWGEENQRVRSWQLIGVLALLGALIGPSFEVFHRHGDYHYYRYYTPQLWGPLVAGTLLAAVTWWGFAVGGLERLRKDWPVLLAGVVQAILFGMELAARNDLLASWNIWMGDKGWRMGLAILYSGLMLLTAIWLIVRGVRLDRGISFFAGVLYLLILVLIRWVDLIGDMVSSAILLFMAGAVLLGTAWVWRKRNAILKRDREVIHV